MLAGAARAWDARVLPELRREHDPVATIGDELADEPLAPGAAVDVGGVEERHPSVERRVEHRAGGPLLEPATEVVAAEPDL